MKVEQKKPLVEGSNFKEGKYEIIFFIGEYFKKFTDIHKIPFWMM